MKVGQIENEEIKGRAIVNSIKHCIRTHQNKTYSEVLNTSLVNAFTWENTAERSMFWATVNEGDKNEVKK
jgi:hypothetical protein